MKERSADGHLLTVVDRTPPAARAPCQMTEWHPRAARADGPNHGCRFQLARAIPVTPPGVACVVNPPPAADLRVPHRPRRPVALGRLCKNCAECLILLSPRSGGSSGCSPRSRRSEPSGYSDSPSFGSVARGQARPDSDVDILVQFTPGAKTFRRFLALNELLEDILGRRVELVTTEALSLFLGPRILAEAKDVLRAA